MISNLKEIRQILTDLKTPAHRKSTVQSIAVAVVVLILSISTTILGTQAFIGLYSVMMERAQFPMIRSEIESLRVDVAATPCSQSTMLRASVAVINQRIEHEHESNRHRYSDWASTDRWNAVERIQFSCE